MSSIRIASVFFGGWVILGVSLVFAESPYQVAWTRQLGTNDSDVSQSVALDAGGNAFISGYTYGALGGSYQGSGGDAFLSKYSDSGTLLWTRQLGTSNSDWSHSVAVDLNGNAFISGYTAGALSGTNQGGNDAFLSKYDAAGTLLWTKQLGTTASDKSYSVAVDTGGNAFISGYTSGALNGPNQGGGDAFLSKYDATGTFLWSRQLGTSFGDGSQCVTVDGDGNAIIGGYTGGALYGTNQGGTDAFLSKYSATGTLLWKRQLGTDADESIYSAAVDAKGDMFVSGDTRGALGGPYQGGGDAFLSKYDASGTFLWTRQLGTSFADRSYSIAVDGGGNAFISGLTSGHMVDGPTPGGDADAFVSKYDASGTLLWTQQLGTNAVDGSHSVALDAGGNLFISGYTTGALGSPANPIYGDAFLMKLASVPEPGSITLLLAGALGLLVYVWRRRKQV